MILSRSLKRTCILIGLIFFANCSTAQKNQQLCLNQNEVLGELANKDCQFENIFIGDEPEKILHSFLVKESLGLFQSDKMDWLFERQLCPGKEHISDFVHVVTKRNVKILKNEEFLKVFEISYDSKGIIVLSDELRWDEHATVIKRVIHFYKTEYGWKLEGPLFKEGGYLTPETVLTMYARRISETFKKQLSQWVL